MANLDDYVRGASCLYEAVKDRYIQLTGETVEQPHIPLLLDKPFSELPLDISSKMQEYQAILMTGMEANRDKAKSYFNTALYIVFDTTLCTDISTELYEQYRDAADPVWYGMEGMHKDDSIKALRTWIGENMKVTEEELKTI